MAWYGVGGYTNRMVRCTAFNFDAKTDELIELGAVPAALEAGKFVWVDAQCEPGCARALLEKELAAVLKLSKEACLLMSKDKPDTGYEHLPDGLHMSMAACAHQNLRKRVTATRVDALLCDRFLLTIARGPAPFLDAIRRDYREDFRRFAHTHGFLLYELWDHLTRSYESLEHVLEHEVERIQVRMAGRPEAEAFPLASRVAANLVRLRRHVAPARAVVHELSTRRFAHVPPTTQPFLQSTAAELDRVLIDLTTSREILTDTVTLSMSYVSFRTNRIITRLTTMSFIFLPLTFLVGVYGMNFQHQPEYKWRFGYGFFWVIASLVAALGWATLWLLWRKERWTPRRRDGSKAAQPSVPPARAAEPREAVANDDAGAPEST